VDAGGDANGTDAVVGAPVQTNEWGGVIRPKRTKTAHMPVGVDHAHRRATLDAVCTGDRG